MHRGTLALLLLCLLHSVAWGKGKHKVAVPTPPTPASSAPVPATPGAGKHRDSKKHNEGAQAPSNAENLWSGDITHDLSLDHDYTVLPKTSATIHPGVTITLGTNVTITILGALNSVGNQRNPIRFLGVPPSGNNNKAGGANIVIGAGGFAHFKYAQFQYMGSSTKGALAVQGAGASLELTDSLFTNISGSAVVGKRGTIAPMTNLQFSDVSASALAVYEDKVPSLSVSKSTFTRCGDYSVMSWRYAGALSVTDSSFQESAAYAIFADGDGSFDVRGNHFGKNQGVFGCRNHSLEDTKDAGPSANIFSDNILKGNAVDKTSDAWSQGNLVYIHGCYMQMRNNDILFSSAMQGMKGGGKHLPPNLINLFDSQVEMFNNTIANNTGFLYILNVGGSRTKLRLEGNILSNSNTNGKSNYEIANEASGVRVNAVSNWWGCATKDCIGTRILDFADGGEKYGVVEYEPFLLSADLTQTADSSTIEQEPDYWDYYDGTGNDYDYGEDWGLQDDEVKYIVEHEDIWSVDKKVSDSVWIKKDGSLTILVDEFSTENITIRMGPGVSIHVDGSIQILGQAGRPVKFVPFDMPGTPDYKPWGTITFSKDSRGTVDEAVYLGSVIKHAEFIGGGVPPEPVAPASTKPAKPTRAKAMVMANGPDLLFDHASFINSASGGLLAMRGNITVSECIFVETTGNAVAHHSTGILQVVKSKFVRNNKYPVLITKAAYNITDSEFVGENNGVLCVRRKRTESMPNLKGTGAAQTLPTSNFSRNSVIGNNYAPGSDCWGDTGDDSYLLAAFAGKPTIMESNLFFDNRCDPKAVRRRASIYLVTADDMLKMSSNTMSRNLGTLYVGRKPVVVESWQHEPEPVLIEDNSITDNQFFRVYFAIPGRRLFLNKNRLESNEVSDEASLKATALLEVIGGDFTNRAMMMSDNHFLGNEGTTLVVRLHDRCIAKGNWFSNPFIKYEFEFANPDTTGFQGQGNYWGDFGPDDASEVQKRFKMSKAVKVPKRWYAHWITSDGTQANMLDEPENVIRDQDKASATLIFLVVIVMGTMIVLGVIVFLWVKVPGAYTALELEEVKPTD